MPSWRAQGHLYTYLCKPFNFSDLSTLYLVHPVPILAMYKLYTVLLNLYTQYCLTWMFLSFVHVVKFEFVSCVLLLVLSCIVCNCCWFDRVYCCGYLVCFVVVVLCVLLSSYVYLLYYVCIAFFTLDAGLLARSHYSEGPAIGHHDTGFSWFSCV